MDNNPKSKMNWWVDIGIFLAPFGMTLLASALVKEQAFVFGVIASAICSVFLGVRITFRLDMPTALKVFFGILSTAMFLVVNLAACLYFGCVYLGGKF